MGWGQSGHMRGIDAMRVKGIKWNEEGVVLAGGISVHRYPKTAGCAERGKQLGMIRCSQGLWIREILPSRGATWVQR